MKTGVQLFGVLVNRRDADVPRTLEALRDMGFGQIEPCVALEDIPGMEHCIWPEGKLREYLGRVADMGLEIPSCHVFARDMAASAEALAALARDCGIRRLVVKSPGELTEASLRRAAEDYTRAAEALAEAGAELLIHNESADIAARLDGVTAYERLLDLCGGKVFAQVDVGWALHGGEDPEALLRRNAGRVRSLHFKDFARRDGALAEVVPGHGVVDTAACLRFALDNGCPRIIDMDGFPGGMEADLGAALRALTELAE